jgi:hypothetical protein
MITEENITWQVLSEEEWIHAVCLSKTQGNMPIKLSPIFFTLIKGYAVFGIGDAFIDIYILYS